MRLPWRNRAIEMFVNLNIRLFDEMLRIFPFGFMSRVIGHEPADLTVHPPPPQNCRGWVHFFRIGV